MKRFWAALAVAVLTIFIAAACNDYGNTFQYPGGAAVTFLSPSQFPACPAPCSNGSGFTLTINGSGFVKQTVVQWNGTTCPLSGTSGATNAPCTTNITLDSNNNVTLLTATITPALIAQPGTAVVNTKNPSSNYGSGAGTNGLSNAITFIINNPPNAVPTVTSVSPACTVVGSPLPITVTGTNFMNIPGANDPTGTQYSTLTWTLGSSQLRLTPYTATAATITSTQITATIPAGNVNVAGTAAITVSNPPSTPVPNVAGSTGSGGGTSAPPVTVTVQTSACPAAAKASATTDAMSTLAEETPAVSLDGRHVAYAASQNGHVQILLRDTCEGASTTCRPQTSLLSVAANGDPGSGDSHTPSMSSDSRYVAFSSDATNLVENAPPGRQIYLRDTCVGADASCKASTILVSTDPGGALVGAESILPSVSASGRFVAFLALTPGHPSEQAKSPGSARNGGFRQVFVRDTCLGFRSGQFLLNFGVLLRPDASEDATNCTPKTTRISIQPGDGTGSDANPAGPALDGQAKHVAMTGAKNSTLFTRFVAVDDSVFLSATSDQH